MSRLVEEQANAWSESDHEWTASSTHTVSVSAADAARGVWRFGPWTIQALGTRTVASATYATTLHIELAPSENAVNGAYDARNSGNAQNADSAPFLSSGFGAQISTVSSTDPAGPSFVFGGIDIVPVCRGFRLDFGTLQTNAAMAAEPAISVLVQKRWAAHRVLEYSLKILERAAHADTRVVVTQWFAPHAADAAPIADEAYGIVQLTTPSSPHGYRREWLVSPAAPGSSAASGYDALEGVALVWRVPVGGGLASGLTAGGLLLYVLLLTLMFALLWWAFSMWWSMGARVLRGSTAGAASVSGQSAK